MLLIRFLDGREGNITSFSDLYVIVLLALIL